MSDFLNRQSSPLSDEQWKAFEDAIVSVAREQLVGRRFIPIVGPLGAVALAEDSLIFNGKAEMGISGCHGDKPKIVCRSEQSI